MCDTIFEATTHDPGRYWNYDPVMNRWTNVGVAYNFGYMGKQYFTKRFPKEMAYIAQEENFSISRLPNPF